MKRYIKSSSGRPYLYIFKHGLGPGTLPKDVDIVKTKDLPNGYTAVWLDRFLTTDELRQYDIPSETDINYYLDRIGYCQKHGDVVPCDDVDACDKVTASTIPTSDIELLAKEALNCSTRDELSSVIGSLLSIDKKLYLHYMEMLRDDSLSVAYIAGQLSDELMSYYVDDYALVYGDDVTACTKVTASEICYRDKDNDDRVVALDAGMSTEDVEKMLAEHPSYYRSTLDRFEACNDITASTNGLQGDFTVIQEIYDDFNEPDNVPPVYTQEYEVNLDEVLAKYPKVANRALEDWSDETFKAGDMITNTLFARYVENVVRGDSDQLYSDFKDYVAQHPELPDPCREIEVRINNPQCLPSAEEIRRRHSEEMGRYLGKKLGLGRW